VLSAFRAEEETVYGAPAMQQLPFEPGVFEGHFGKTMHNAQQFAKGGFGEVWRAERGPMYAGGS